MYASYICSTHARIIHLLILEKTYFYFNLPREISADLIHDNDKIVGHHVPTGSVPTLMDEIKRAKLDLDISMFSKH